MSGGDENPFARWSRRKQAARSGEPPALREEEQAQPIEAQDADAGPLDRQTAGEPEASDGDAADPAEVLPRIEDLTAQSDLSAFLREGVPAALRSAAMRKMWSLDPGIRDYVGPAEYAWDFNQPGSMPGFGPLDAKDAVVSFLSKPGSGLKAEMQEAAAETEAPPAQPRQPTEPSAEPQASALQDADAEPSSEPAEPRPEPADLPPPAPDGREVAAGQVETAGPDPSPPLAGRPRHGGAMPR